MTDNYIIKELSIQLLESRKELHSFEAHSEYIKDNEEFMSFHFGLLSNLNVTDEVITKAKNLYQKQLKSLYNRELFTNNHFRKIELEKEIAAIEEILEKFKPN